MMETVREMCARLANPLWMPNPSSWVWAGVSGQPQGPGMVARQDPGLANLLWLAVDLQRPPARYDLRANMLATLMLMRGRAALFAGESMADYAQLLSLQQFHAALGRLPAGANAELLARLRTLAARRLDHADA